MNTFKLDNKEQAKALKWVQLAASKDQSRPILNGLYINNGETVGCDGFRLHIIETPEPFTDSIAVQGKVIQQLNTVALTPRIEEYIEYEGGDYPAYEQIIPSDKPVFKIAVNKKLLAALAAMPGDEAIILSFTGDNKPIKVTSGSSDCKAVAVIMPMHLPNHTRINTTLKHKDSLS